VPDRCADRSRRSGEPAYGTASLARRWVLLEQPGAWGADVLRESDLPPEVGRHLGQLAAALPARVLLVRRTGGEARLGTERSLFVCSTSRDGSWLERFELDHVRDVLALSLTELASGRSVGGDRVTEPLYLVCTNGKHDPCCATYGLPVARELTDLVGDRVWECSHVGGDRFAGNLVCLPDGLFYGHLDPATARLAVAANEGGRLLLDHWRGRSSLPFAVQAAEALVRDRLGLDRVAAVHVLRSERRGAELHVRFAVVGGGEITAVVREERTSGGRALTCGGQPSRPPVYSLVALDPSSPG
jgi:hypothetical protein